MSAVRYAYKPKTHVMVLATLFFLACAAGLAYMAASNDGGLIVNGIFELDESGATVFYYVLAGLSVAMGLGGIYGLIMSMRAPRFVILDESGIEIPGNAGRQPARIPYKSITALQSGSSYNQRWLYVSDASGRRAIMGSMLEGKNTLDEIERLLSQRIQG